MPSAQPSPAAKAIGYAEGTLKVHEIFDETVNCKHSLDEILVRLSERRDQRREAEEALRDRENEIASDLYGSNPDWSATKLDAASKSARQADPFHKALRSKISEILGAIDRLEHEKLVAETEIKIGVARMTELGGYLMYLAAVKNANTTEKPEKPA